MIAINNSAVWEEYQRAIEYQRKMGFAKDWPEYTNFVEGKQWPSPTKKTQFMPRPVVNQCDSTVENKQSNILSQTLKMMFTPAEMPEGQDNAAQLQASQDYTDAAATTWDDIDQDTLNEECVNDTLILGTGVFHYFFDNSITSDGATPFVGKQQGEVIDPIDLMLGNPQLKASQIQKQPWIIIRSQVDTLELQERAKANGKDPTLITSDSNTLDSLYTSGKIDIDQPSTTTLLTKYYKENKAVMWVQVTKDATVQDPTPLSPSDKPFTLYPVEVLIFKKRRKCTFGRSVIGDMIPNQKALNWGLGMMLLSVQQTAWPKLLVKMGALSQAVTNEPGEILTDNSAIAGVDGIKYMQPPNFTSMPIVLAEKIMDMTRQVTGTTEVTSGEVIGANMAASAIIALQNQAKKPTDAMVQLLVRSLKRVGRIYEEFNKCFSTMPRPIQSQDAQGQDITRQFVGAESKDINFELKIDVTPTGVLTESLQMTIIKEYADRQWLDKFQATKYSPANLIPAQMKQDFEEEEKQAKALQAQQAAQAAQQAQMQQHAGNIMGALTPEEQAAVQQDPTLVNKAVNSIQGGAK